MKKTWPSMDIDHATRALPGQMEFKFGGTAVDRLSFVNGQPADGAIHGRGLGRRARFSRRSSKQPASRKPLRRRKRKKSAQCLKKSGADDDGSRPVNSTAAAIFMRQLLAPRTIRKTFRRKTRGFLARSLLCRHRIHTKQRQEGKKKRLGPLVPEASGPSKRRARFQAAAQAADRTNFDEQAKSVGPGLRSSRAEKVGGADRPIIHRARTSLARQTAAGEAAKAAAEHLDRRSSSATCTVE